MLTHIDLFSGIGGFALAAQWAGFKTVVFCEIEPFCQEVLKARFGVVAESSGARLERHNTLDTESPREKGGLCRKVGQPTSQNPLLGAVGNFDKGQLARSSESRFSRRKNPDTIGSDCVPVLYSDIRNFDGRRWRGATLLTAGVPCQPASIAGKRRGTKDNRWLWGEALRILAEVKPTWAIFENPCGILSLEQGMVFEGLLSQMEAEGYEVQPLIIPACAVNAPHRRDRVWIIAYASGGESGQPKAWDGRKNISGTDSHTPDTTQRPQLSANEISPVRGGNTRTDIGRGRDDAPDTAEIRRGQGNQDAGRPCKGTGATGEWRRPPNTNWDKPWPEVATRLCRVDDGVASELDETGRISAQSKNEHKKKTAAGRVHRLKALGNAIVPTVAFEIIEKIARIEKA